jgi:DNA-binding NarL/FixJ family response regulator
MSISISNSFSPASFAAANAVSNSASAQKTPQTTNEPADTVQLSQSQRVHQLYKQGQRVSQIASGLSLTVAAVNSYLGITNAK